MRRMLAIAGGTLELGIAIGLIVLAFQLPSRDRVARSFNRFEQVTQGAQQQIAALQDQVGDLKRPETQRVAEQLSVQIKQITLLLQRSRIDFTTLEATGKGLGEVATGLENWSATLDVDRLRQMADGFGTAAEFLDENLSASAQEAADGLQEALGTLTKDAQLLASLLQKAPPDLKAARDIHDSLAKFDAGLERVNQVLKLERFDTIRDGLSGMETSLNTTAGQVERMSNFTYPIVKFSGLKPIVEQKQFWPEGETIAEGLRKAVKGMESAGQELDGLHKNLPELRIALDESRKVLARTREAMGQALKQQTEIESLLREVPKLTSTLAERLPKLGESFAKMLRETKRLKEVAGSLRQAQKGLITAADQWPKLKEALQRSAVVLRTTEAQFAQLLQNREAYNKGMNGVTDLTEQFAASLPVMHQQFDARLSQQEQALTTLNTGLVEVNAALPDAMQATGDAITIARWLLGLVGVLVMLHAINLVMMGGRAKS